MKKSRFKVEQIVRALKEVEAGAAARDVCRRLGVTEQTFYRWRAQYGDVLPENWSKVKVRVRVHSRKERYLEMKKSRFKVEQIVRALKEVEGGAAARDVCRRLGVTEQTFYRWRAQYGGLDLTDAKRMRELLDENQRLRRAVAELTLDVQILRDVNSKKW